MFRDISDHLVNHLCWPLRYSLWCVFGITEKPIHAFISLLALLYTCVPSWTLNSLVTNLRLSWKLFLFILISCCTVKVVLAAKQFRIISLLPQPLTDSIVFSELMASPSHLQTYCWSLWPRQRAYRKMDAAQTLSFRLPAAGLRRKQTENRTHIKTAQQQRAPGLDCNCFYKADSLR